MSINQKTEHLRPLIRAVLEAPTSRFDHLVAASGLNPKRELRYGDWKDVDFSGADLRGFDFTGADLTGARFENALITGMIVIDAIFKYDALERAADFQRFTIERLTQKREGDDLELSQSRSERESVSPKLRFSRQTTLRSRVTVTGVGVHSGTLANLTMGPAPIDAGFVFVRTDPEGRNRKLQANGNAVIATELATVLGDLQGVFVSTAEHVLAALRGLGIDNATIEVDGPEVPIMDGSAAAFVTAIDRAGIKEQAAPRRYVEILKPVQVSIGESFAELGPYSGGLRAEVEINFSNPMIGRQGYVFDLTPDSFRRDISRARTFGVMGDVKILLKAGFARGASLDNSVVFDGDQVLNPEGLRYADECVRHKVLDAIGELALAGLPLIGLYRSVRGGHRLNHAVLRALFADPTAWRVVEAEPSRPKVKTSQTASIAPVHREVPAWWYASEGTPSG